MIRIAKDASLFTHLSAARASVSLHAVDGRLGLAREPEGRFGLLVLDAFSSDAIPVHQRGHLIENGHVAVILQIPFMRANFRGDRAEGDPAD